MHPTQAPVQPREQIRTPRLINAVLAVTAVYSAAWLVYALAADKQLYQKIGPAAVALGCLVVFRFGVAVRVVTALLIGGIVLGMYAGEIVLGMSDPELKLEQAVRKEAARAGTAFDGRTRFQVIMDLRRQGVSAYPPLYPHVLIESPLLVDGAPTIPLASLPEVTTISCNEDGQYLRFMTDERGFRNPTGIWQRGRTGMGIIGDSMALGECVAPAENTIAGQIRARYPDTLTLGAGGNGPLLELASLREYMSLLKPATVLWFFYEGNDMNDLETDKAAPLLRRYLATDFRQGLAEKQPGLNQAIQKFFDQEAAEAEKGRQTAPWRQRLKEFLVLHQLRGVVNQIFPPAPHWDFDLLEKVFRQGHDEIQGWGGRMVICYLPAPFRYEYPFSRQRRAELQEIHRRVMMMAEALRVPVIDTSTLFSDAPAAQSSNLTRYFYPYFAHYRPEGHRMIGQAIVKRLSGE
jgi:hypothetical protein